MSLVIFALLKFRRFIPLFLIAAAGVLAYHNSFRGPFIFDDLPSIPENPTIRSLWPIWPVLNPPVFQGGGRPFLNVTLAINYALGGTNVWGYHAVNLLIHILAGLTLFGVVRRTAVTCRARSPEGHRAEGTTAGNPNDRPAPPALSDVLEPTLLALAIAVIWVVHPLTTEAVTYVNQRAESLMGLFYLLTLYCLIRGAESDTHSRAWAGLCVMACALGMASKEAMISAPVVAFVYDRTFLSGSFQQAWQRRGRLYLGLAATWLLLGYLMYVTGKAGGYRVAISNYKYLLTQLYAICRYLQLSLWPHPLIFDYGSPLIDSIKQVIPQAAVVSLLLVGTCICLWRWPAIGFLGIWFFAILAPTSSIVPQATQTIAERRMYLPTAAVVTLVVIGVYSLLGRRSMAVFAAVAVALGFVTVQRNKDYRSLFAIWEDTAAKLPDNPRAHNNLGIAYVQNGALSNAIYHFSCVVKAQPDDAEGNANLGMAYFSEGELQKAIQHFEIALRSNPKLTDVWLNLGIAAGRLGNFARAAEAFQEVLRLDPTNEPARVMLTQVSALQSSTRTSPRQ